MESDQGDVIKRLLKPDVHLRRKHKHKSVHTCDKHKPKVTYAGAVPLNFDRHCTIQYFGSRARFLVLMLALYRLTRATQRRKHKRKHNKKERFIFLVLASPRFIRTFVMLILMLASYVLNSWLLIQGPWKSSQRVGVSCTGIMWVVLHLKYDDGNWLNGTIDLHSLG